jgi:hypothetical protein
MTSVIKGGFYLFFIVFFGRHQRDIPPMDHGHLIFKTEVSIFQPRGEV